MKEQEHPKTLVVQTEGLLKLNKASINDQISKAVQSVKDGWVDPIDAFLYAKKGESLFKDLTGKLKPLAESVSIGKELTRHEATITEKMQGVKYSYDECNDPEWNSLQDELAILKEKIEQRQKFLQAIVKPLELVDIDTGETYTVNPPIKSGSLGFEVKLK